MIHLYYMSQQSVYKHLQYTHTHSYSFAFTSRSRLVSVNSAYFHLMFRLLFYFMIICKITFKIVCSRFEIYFFWHTKIQFFSNQFFLFLKMVKAPTYIFSSCCFYFLNINLGRATDEHTLTGARFECHCHCPPGSRDSKQQQQQNLKRREKRKSRKERERDREREWATVGDDRVGSIRKQKH